MESVVYFLGAGFSAPLGLPVMSNFLQKSKDIYALDVKKYEHFESVFRKINQMAVSKNYFDADLFNIEEILSILEMEHQIHGGDQTRSFVKYILDVIEHFTPSVQLSASDSQTWFSSIFQPHVLHLYGYFIASLLNLEVRAQIHRPQSGNQNRPTFYRPVFRKSSTPKTLYSITTALRPALG